MLPKTVYVKYEDDGGDGYLVADYAVRELVDPDEAVEIGEYRLVKKSNYSLRVEECK